MHWIEQLDHNHEVVRVACHGGKYTHRVVCHGNRSWHVEERKGALWTLHQFMPRNARWHRARLWRSPQTAMAFVETLFTSEGRKP